MSRRRTRRVDALADRVADSFLAADLTAAQLEVLSEFRRRHLENGLSRALKTWHGGVRSRFESSTKTLKPARRLRRTSTAVTKCPHSRSVYVAGESSARISVGAAQNTAMVHADSRRYATGNVPTSGN